MSGVSDMPKGAGMGRGRGRGRGKAKEQQPPAPAPMPVYNAAPEEEPRAYRPGGFGRQEVVGSVENVYDASSLKGMYQPTPYPEAMPRGDHSSDLPILPRFRARDEEKKQSTDTTSQPALLFEKQPAPAAPAADDFWSIPTSKPAPMPAASGPTPEEQLQQQLVDMKRRMDEMERSSREAELRKAEEAERMKQENAALKQKLWREEEERKLAETRLEAERRAEEEENERRLASEELEAVRQAAEARLEKRRLEMELREAERRAEEERREEEKHQEEMHKEEERRRKQEEKERKEQLKRDAEEKRKQDQAKKEEAKRREEEAKKKPAKGVWEVDTSARDASAKKPKAAAVASKPAAKQAKPVPSDSDSDDLDFASLHTNLQKQQTGKKEKKKQNQPNQSNQSLKDIQNQQQKESQKEKQRKEKEKAEAAAKAAAAQKAATPWGGAWGAAPKPKMSLKDIQAEELRKAGKAPQPQQQTANKKKHKRKKVDYSAEDNNVAPKKEEDEELTFDTMAPVIDTELLNWTMSRLQAVLGAKSGIDVDSTAQIFCTASSKDELRTSVSDQLGLRKGASQFAEDFIAKKWPSGQLKAQLLSKAEKQQTKKAAPGKTRKGKNANGQSLLGFGVTAGSNFNVDGLETL